MMWGPEGGLSAVVGPLKRLAYRCTQSELIRGSASALTIKFVGSITGFVMFALAARVMDPGEFGALAVIFNTMAFLSVAALCGQETLIVRSWDEYVQSRPALAGGALRFGMQVAALASTSVAIVVGALWALRSGSLSLLIVGACAFLLMNALLQFSAQLARVTAGIVIGELPREIVWRAMVAGAILIHQATGTSFSATEFFVTASAALVASVSFQAWRVFRALPPEVKHAEPQFDIATWLPRSAQMWMSALLDTTSQYAEVIVIGLVLGPATAGAYFVATRITNVFAMIAGAITAYATTQISGLFHAKESVRLQAVLRSLSLISAGLAGLALLIVVFAGELLLRAFGAAYASAYPSLIVLGIGAAVLTLSGPAAYVLLLTGNERAYPRIMAAGLIARFLLIVALGPTFGLLGAAVAWTLSSIGIAVALVLSCRRLVRLDPSLLYLVHPHSIESPVLGEQPR